MAFIWSLILGINFYTSQIHVHIDMRAVSFTSFFLYLIALCTYYELYDQPHNLPVPYIKSSIWTFMLLSVLSCCLTVVDARRQRLIRPIIQYLGRPFCSDTIESLRTCLLGDAAFWKSRAGHADASIFDSSADLEEAMLARNTSSGSRGSAENIPSHPLIAAAAAEQTYQDEMANAGESRMWMSLFADACSYVWPDRLSLQIRTLICLVLLFCTRFLNLIVPILYKKLVDRFAASSNPDTSYSWLQLMSPWVVLYLTAFFFQGGSGGGTVGIVNNIRSFLWVPVSQDAFKRISVQTFNKIIGLDLSFHLKRKTGEVTKIVDRGTNAMQNILSTVLFNIMPQILDVFVAATYLAQALEPSVAIIVFITVGSYIPLTIVVTEWRGKLRREMNMADQIKGARGTDALLNYETVKIFTNEDYESHQFSAAIDSYQVAEYKSLYSFNLLNVLQSFVMFAGVASGLLVCAGGVSRHTLTVGDTVLFLSLMSQLYGPLNFFGSYYRTIQQYMIDMENLLELLAKNPTVSDRPGAKDLVVKEGSLQFNNVSFQYDAGAPVINGINFSVAGGKTIAFVGATGGGKSTITRLLLRFYDVSSGAVLIDGQDVRSITQKSLRRIIGVVPQDTVLFNDSIFHNIHYGNLNASEEEVHEAAKMACIHETITTRFPQGYATVVGERGLRLSGGEKQRVAVARALLRNPKILVLDEATSALDSITEKKIQGALANLRNNRTNVIVAHRLSTISDADTIVVIDKGHIAEMGIHNDLVTIPSGIYSTMWSKQAGEEAIQAIKNDINDSLDVPKPTCPAHINASTEAPRRCPHAH
eukprot:CAMPEP_0175051040 /NCGR_PEP_ID=MMETSP0052_2-20121109/7575_1 /TAXON_ID=51329 ORGANISM="Polytomella parva, Strain SAG 63-3" /NCGR_SAMPLE_ID=MMETSP0052_2 /ASSEMBLY_ACC=CAM_ASM_000194 /LENGTH=815 /DNA_ID=CAMNT_0016315273 /DNA_START=575 /DNA_END=3023 /DNA_ORIENTATION=-